MDSLFSLFDSEIHELIPEFLESSNLWWLTGGKNARQEVYNDLSDSFSKVVSLKDLTDKLFWEQINGVRRKYNDDSVKRIRGLRAIVFLYKYVISNHPELYLFSDSRTLYPSLLTNRSFVTEWLESHFAFMTFKAGLKYDNRDRFIFILRGAEQESSKFQGHDYIKLDLTPIISPLYRKCVFEYVCSGIDRIKNFNITVYSFPLNCLTELKRAAGYRNSADNLLNSSESAYISEKIRQKCNNNESSIQSLSSQIKCFFDWCVRSNYLIVDNNFFDLFTYHRRKSAEPRKSRPDAGVLTILLEASKKKAEEDPAMYLVMDAILRLLLSLPLRVSDICSLQRDCVRRSLKPCSFFLRHLSKTAHGSYEETPITSREKALIDKVLDYNQSLVEKTVPEFRNMVFLYIVRKQRDRIRIADKLSFRLYMDMLRTENHLPMVNATNLRKEYQSQVKSFVIRENKDDVEYRALSGHKNSETTDRHYAKIRIEDYFEQMYQVFLGDRHEEIKKKVMETVPKNLERVGDFENKCGACNASECLAKAALPCFLCKDFITSKEFLPVFERMVDGIDERILASGKPHDKEDLTAVKSVLVSYIVELSRIV